MRRLGFRPESLAVAIPPGGTVDVAVRLVGPRRTTRPVIVATPDIRRLRPRAVRAFHERRERGFGRFFTADEIDRRNPPSSELLRTLPGTRITRRAGRTS